ncbi:TPA: hypothetical protein MEA72_004518 [Klebsiella aerogenes]|nr:hypothetical protein [Klebsiella aerogenes]
MIRLIIAVLMLASVWCSPALAVAIPCAHITTESGHVGDELHAGIKICDGADAPVPPPTTGNVKIRVGWFHLNDNRFKQDGDVLDLGPYQPGMTWSDLANMCKNSDRCGAFTGTHVQQQAGQICTQLIVNQDQEYDYLPSVHASLAPPSCVVVGNECSWEASNYLVDFGTVNSSAVNGLTKEISVNIQCGFATDVSFSLASDSLALSRDNFDSISALFTLDGVQLSATPIKMAQRPGSNLHTLRTTLKSSGTLPNGKFSGSLVIVAGYD